jgi:hypothetical protein
MTAAAIDRLVHHSVIIELNIPSYRVEHAKKNQQRVDSSLLLPNASRCLMRNVTRSKKGDGWQIEEATERDDET